MSFGWLHYDDCGFVIPITNVRLAGGLIHVSGPLTPMPTSQFTIGGRMRIVGDDGSTVVAALIGDSQVAPAGTSLTVVQTVKWTAVSGIPVIDLDAEWPRLQVLFDEIERDF